MSAYNIIDHEYDVLVVGAGGAGLSAAISASQDSKMRVGLICKSLLGKAHTVMAEGGMAAALGNVDNRDDWKIHFRDTMRGGKMLNNWKMAEIHAKNSPVSLYMQTIPEIFPDLSLSISRAVHSICISIP